MGCQIAVRSFITVLFSTVLVYQPASGQGADDLYRHLKAHPNLSKEQVDQAKAEKLDSGRMKKLHDDLDANRKREAELDRKAEAQPDVPDPPEDKDIDSDKPATALGKAGSTSAPGKADAAGAGANGSRYHGGSAPSSNTTSADSPKVAFDPMPDEIHFDGEETAPAAASKPAPKRAVKPPPRRAIRHR